MLGEILRSRGLSMRACGLALRVQGPTVHSWIHGTKRPRAEYRDVIEATFGVPASAWKTDDDRALMVPADESGPLPTETPAATGTDNI